jgi:hypothetical protein
METSRATSFVLALATLACADEKPAPTPETAPSAAGVGLDAMTDYMRKSKSAEAQVNLRSIAQSVRAASEEIAQDGGPAKLASAPLTPPAGECCKQPQKKCMPGTVDWTHPAWRAIGFQRDDPHYYSYELVIEQGAFVARAVGDLDCDGELATFELRGTLGPDGSYELAAPTSMSPLE